jgi:L-fuculose-phosphate aldolase
MRIRPSPRSIVDLARSTRARLVPRIRSDVVDEGAALAIVAAGRRLGARGLVVAAEGNLSVRLDDDRLLVSPSGRRKDELDPRDLVVVALATGRPVGPGRPSSDIAIHRAVYRARPDVRAIVHAHLPAALALSLADETPDPRVLPETALLLPRVPLVPFGTMGSDELAGRIADALASGSDGDRPRAALLERHGAIAVGRDLVDAGDALELVDLLCRVWRDARLLAPGRRFGPPVAPPPPDGAAV